LAASAAAWISILPWVREFQARAHLAESSNLKSSMDQIKGLDKVADLIRQSNAQWQGIQDASGRTIIAAREISDRMKVEAEEFMKFMAAAQDKERAGLRLEVEKLRRMEGDWLKVTVQILDHIFAVNRAAERSGQRQLIAQLSQFQNACRDVARRMGLAAFVPELGEIFEARAHQLPEGQSSDSAGGQISDVLAPGFTYQGQLLRRALVMLNGARLEAQPAHQLHPEEHPQAGAANLDEPELASERDQPAEPEPITRSPDENPEIAAGVDVFEEVEFDDSRIETASGNADRESHPAQEKKQSPQEELPF
jgi:molecular chaperone GrpE (heat shock protein)